MIRSFLGIVNKVLGIIRSVVPSTDRKLGRKETELEHHEKADEAKKRMRNVPKSDTRDLPDRLRDEGL